MPTLKDVAKLAGVTVTTVSRVLNNRGYIGADTRQKVMDAMQALDYQPNELARSLIFQRSNIIGLLVPSVAHPFFGLLVDALEREASQRGYKVMLCNSRHESAKEISYIDMLKRNKVDGIIMASRTINIDPFLHLKMPLLTFDRIFSPDIPFVASDNLYGGKLAALHLIAKGCRNLIYIGGSKNLQQLSNQRGEGFADICSQQGIAYFMADTEEASFISMHYEAAIEQTLADHPEVDGIFASSDVIAAQVVKAVLDRGLRIPEDVRVVGYDDSTVAQLVHPGITTIRQSTDDLGAIMIDLLDQMIKGVTVPKQNILPVELIERQST
jgi:LacI family sucrose operon transcriptional repressor